MVNHVFSVFPMKVWNRSDLIIDHQLCSPILFLQKVSYLALLSCSRTQHNVSEEARTRDPRYEVQLSTLFNFCWVNFGLTPLPLVVTLCLLITTPCQVCSWSKLFDTLTLYTFWPVHRMIVLFLLSAGGNLWSCYINKKSGASCYLFMIKFPDKTILSGWTS